jgi:hypothetical protein
MLNSKIQKLLDEFNNSPIAIYYEKYGDKRASQNALSALRMKNKMPKIRQAKTEIKFPKELLKKLHKECKTRTELMNKTKLSNDAYERLCKLYKLKEKRFDKTTKNGGASVPIIVYKLIEVPCEIYSSRLKAKQTIFPSDKKIGLRIRDGELNYDKKIDYQTDKDGRKIRARLTGNQTQIGNRTPSNEVQIYELVEEFVGEFPSREEVYRQLDNELAISAQLRGIIYQSKGYRFYELN